ncbi:MAG: hypothetical protein RR052_03045 [Oscillospiraceae bacterium]
MKTLINIGEKINAEEKTVFFKHPAVFYALVLFCFPTLILGGLAVVATLIFLPLSLIFGWG